ncbi:MAG: TonB-dependent receptor domain-containing protein, partial [Ignavibacteriales bacterium]
DYEPMDGLRFRLSRQRAVRAPNIQELYRPQTIQLDGSTDPCAGATPEATQAQCALTGVSAAQYGNILANPAEQYNGITGGNPNLQPENADTLTLGVVYSPTFLPRSSISLDWYNIKVENLIGTVGADLAINRCIQTGDPYYCGLVQRAPGTGSLFSGGGAIVDTNLNTGSLEVQGLDVEANYRVDLDDLHLPNYGGLSFNFVGSWLEKYVVQPLPGDPTYDCVGLFGSICGTPIPQWRHKLRVTWSTPWNLQLSANWRHIGGVDLDKTSSNPQLHGTVRASDKEIDSFNWLDLSGSWTVADKYTFRAGVNNVFDKEPPLIGASSLTPVFGEGNTFPQVYDPLGRYVFVGLTANF